MHQLATSKFTDTRKLYLNFNFKEYSNRPKLSISACSQNIRIILSLVLVLPVLVQLYAYA
jgi:hypothetical protein